MPLTTLDYILGICLIAMAIFLTIAVLMQNGKSHNLSGTIAGGAETFFGKSKGRTIDALLSKITTVVSVIFVLVVLVVYIFVGNDADDKKDSSSTNQENSGVSQQEDDKKDESKS